MYRRHTAQWWVAVARVDEAKRKAERHEYHVSVLAVHHSNKNIKTIIYYYILLNLLRSYISVK